MANWDKFLDQAPKIIAEAAKSPLGIIALIILALSALGLAFFSDSPDQVQVVVFLVLVLSFGLFGFAAMRQMPAARTQAREKSTAEPRKPSATSAPVPSQPTVFISYSHKDEEWKDRLRPHLGMLEKIGRLTIWDDREIDPGEEWFEKISGVMERAAVTICLISADYLNSDFCVKEEIPYLLQRRKRDGMVLILILVRPCAWEVVPWLKAIQMLPRDGKSISKDYKDNWDEVTSVRLKIE